MLSVKGYYVIQKSELEKTVYEKVVKDLTLEPIVKYVRKGFVPPKASPIILGYESEKVDLATGRKVEYIHMPRFYAFEKFGPPQADMLKYGDDISVTFRGSLYEEQREPVGKVLERLQQPFCSGGILSLPCGEGKTVSSIYVISVVQKKTLIVVHKEFLMNQWREEIELFLPGARIGFIQGNSKTIDGMDIVIGMIQTMSKREYGVGELQGFGLCIFDECHHLGAHMFSKVLQKVPARRMLGLSAEPIRKDGMNLVFEYFLGNMIFQRERKKGDNVTVHNFVLTSESEKYQPVYDKYGNAMLYKMEENVTLFPARNVLIASIIAFVFEKSTPFAVQRKMLVLSARNEGHLPLLEEAIRALAPHVKIGYYVGRNNTSKKKHTETLSAAKDCDVILGTYDMAQEGLNIKALNCILLASPLGGLKNETIRGEKKEFSNEIKQTVGRILRDKSCPVPRLVFDLTDKFANFEKWSHQRLRYYVKEMYKIKQIFLSLEKFDAFRKMNAANLSEAAVDFLKSTIETTDKEYAQPTFQDSSDDQDCDQDCDQDNDCQDSESNPSCSKESQQPQSLLFEKPDGDYQSAKKKARPTNSVCLFKLS